MTKIVVGFPAGGTADIVARAIGEFMSKDLGGPVIIENRPGAGTALATQGVIRAQADGRTLLLGGTSQLINHYMKGSGLGFDFSRDLTPIGLVASMPALIVAGPACTSGDIRALIEDARGKPGVYLFGSSGTGTSSHLAGVLFSKLTGVELTHVPFRGAASAFSELLGGRIHLMFPNIPEAIGQLQNALLRALAVASPSRSSALPDVPTTHELSLGGFELQVWLGLFAPAQTDTAELARLRQALRNARAHRIIKQRWQELGAELGEDGYEIIDTLIERDSQTLPALVSAAGLRSSPP